MQLPATVRWSAALLPLFGVLTAVGCNRAQPKLASTKPPEVLVDYPITREVTDFEECTGHTEAVDWVEVRAHVWGFLDKVNFREGALVQKDDVLFEIDPRTYEAALDQAKADLESRKATATRAESVYKRTASLVASGNGSPEDLDKDKGDWQV